MTFLRRAGEAWKLPIALFIVPVASLAIVFALLSERIALPINITVSIFFLALIVCAASYIWAAVTIRCPRCAAKVLWLAVRTKGPGEWLTWTAGLESCPVCGSDGSDSRTLHKPDR